MALSANRQVTVSASTLTVGGVISGSGFGLTKAGGGTLVLSGANTYSGNTAINAGTLTLGSAGSIASSPTITVASGATFNVGSVSGGYSVGSSQTINGNGTVSGAATVNGTIAPGNSVGNLTFDNGLTLGAISTYNWELTALTTTGGGTNFDLITITAGNLVIDPGATLALSLSSLTPQNNDPFWNTNRSWTIIDNTGGGTITGTTLAINNGAWSSYGTFATVGIGNDLALNWTAAAVPEPSTYAAILGAVALVGVAIRKRRLRKAG